MSRPRTRYIGSLDGLRAFAVLAVIAYHMGFQWAQGGLLGVTIFFVLSGYLITGLLIAEFRESKSIDLGNFWLRRIRRLVPAIVFVIIGVVALCALFNHALLTKARPDILPSLFFYSNWWQIFHNVSYFQAMGAPSPLQHFWSLAIEEQFYLIWPIVLLILFKLGVKSKPLRRGILVAAAASAIWMAICYDPLGDPSRVYYGTDTRAFSLLIGAWLAFAWPSTGLTETSGQRMSHRSRILFDGVGIAAFIGVVLMVAFANGYSPFLYWGGILLCSILTAVVMAVIVHPRSVFAKFWEFKPFIWIGKRSYGMYLWHYPILLLMTDRNSVGEPNLWWCLLELAIIIGISEFSYRFIENPIRKGKLEDWVRGVRSGSVNVQVYLRNHIVPAGAACALVLVAVIGWAVVPATAGIGGAEQLESAAEQSQQTQEDAAALAATSQTEAEADSNRYDVLMIGDSVAVRTIPYFNETFPKGCIDAAVNRQFYTGKEIYDYYKDLDLVGGTVVFALGTNGVITTDLMDELVTDVGPDKQIYFITTRSPQDWVAEDNAEIFAAAERYGNVHVIDWYGFSAGHSEYFDGDGTHLTEDAAQIYTEMIREALGYVTPVVEEPAAADQDATQADGDAADSEQAADGAAADSEQSTDGSSSGAQSTSDAGATDNEQSAQAA